MQKDEINTLPIQQFINVVKGADAAKKREITINIDTAKRLAFTLGETMAKLNGDLETMLKNKKEQEETIKVTMDGGNTW
jgi:hypothetical protein